MWAFEYFEEDDFSLFFNDIRDKFVKYQIIIVTDVMVTYVTWCWTIISDYYRDWRHGDICNMVLNYHIFEPKILSFDERIGLVTTYFVPYITGWCRLYWKKAKLCDFMTFVKCCQSLCVGGMLPATNPHSAAAKENSCRTWSQSYKRLKVGTYLTQRDGTFLERIHYYYDY